MDMEEKIMRTLEAMEHPESFSKEELHHLLNDPECVAIARDILDSREALARQHAPAPDVNAEWESFKRRNISIETPSPWKRNVKAIRWGAAMLVAASLALLFFSFQIYFDFSGYSDMALGLGRIFGFFQTDLHDFFVGVFGSTQTAVGHIHVMDFVAGFFKHHQRTGHTEVDIVGMTGNRHCSFSHFISRFLQ